MRLTRTTEEGNHHITIPRHDWLRTGTLASILDDIASHLHVSRGALLERLE